MDTSYHFSRHRIKPTDRPGWHRAWFAYYYIARSDRMEAAEIWQRGPGCWEWEAFLDNWRNTSGMCRTLREAKAAAIDALGATA